MSAWWLNYDNTGVTVELGDLVKSGVDIWAFEYPSYYKGEQKTAFEQKVIDHYRFRQIGQETPARFLHYFRTRIKEVMPYYIQLYKSQELMESIEDPFGNVDIVETFEQETTGHSSGTVNGESSGTSSTTNTGTASHDKESENTHTENHTRKFSNTPQGSISNLDDYMTEANVETASDGDNASEHVASESSATSEGTATGTESTTSEGSESGTVKHTLTRKGNQGVNTYAHDMKELRETFLNIDMMIINELKDLFLQVY